MWITNSGSLFLQVIQIAASDGLDYHTYNLDIEPVPYFLEPKKAARWRL